MRPSPNFRPSSSPSGFTLLEMMVTVAVIGVLILIASTAFNTLMKSTDRMRTAQNMRPILSAFHDYAVEHNEYFPPAYFANSKSRDQMDESFAGDGRWLDTTIFAQVYPDVSSSSMDKADTDAEDTTTRERGSASGIHLKGTVFEVLASVKQNPEETNWYNHSFCLNASLITDNEGYAQGSPEFTPRKRSLFPNDSQTMLIIEGSEGDHNSVQMGNMSQLDAAFERYDGRFIHVGFMDGHVERLKRQQIPESDSSNDDYGSFFWRGVDRETYQRKTGGAQKNIQY